MTANLPQAIADEIKRRLKAIVDKERELKDKEIRLQDVEKRLQYREENVARRERIIHGKSNA